VNEETDWTAVSAGRDHSLALKTDGTLWAWGANSWGQLGNGTFEGSSVPVLVDSSLAWTLVSAGGAHSLGIISEGALFAWGANSEGQLGDGTDITRSIPVISGEIVAEEEEGSEEAEAPAQ